MDIGKLLLFGAAELLLRVDESVQLCNGQLFQIATRFKRKAHRLCLPKQICNLRIAEEALTIGQTLTGHCPFRIARMYDGGLPLIQEAA